MLTSALGACGKRWPVAVMVCAVLGVPACGSSAGSSAGTASVAYAASLASLNEKVVGPAFIKAAGKESIGGKPIEALEPRFTTWYIQFAASQIVVAYNPASPHASEFKAIASGHKPVADLFRLMTLPGVKLGRTDPNIDPQGQAFIEMLMLAQAQYHLPAGTVQKIIGGSPSSADSPTIFDEAALEPRLQAGQLDAASAYLPQAIQLHLPYIKLPATINLGDPALATHYATATFPLADGTVAAGKPLTVDISTIGKTCLDAADAFVRYVLSPAGLALHKRGGYVLLTPTAFGDTAAIPAPIRRELGG